jgi:Fuc2NAc and GlcNAc transferase
MGVAIDFSFFGYVLATISVIWILNLFNFMDGIDGIAGVESVCTTVVMGGVCAFFFNADNLVILHFMLGAASLGFLILNFPPARIFMGDAGSGFLGLMLAALLLLSGQVSEDLFWGWLIMLGVFIVDATTTLINRIRSGHKPHEAHCSHAYQNASKLYGSHRLVTLLVLLINLLWLTPITILVALNKVDGFVALVLAYVPLIIVAFKFNAGCSKVIS